MKSTNVYLSQCLYNTICIMFPQYVKANLIAEYKQAQSGMKTSQLCLKTLGSRFLVTFHENLLSNIHSNQLIGSLSNPSQHHTRIMLLYIKQEAGGTGPVHVEVLESKVLQTRFD